MSDLSKAALLLIGGALAQEFALTGRSGAQAHGRSARAAASACAALVLAVAAPLNWTVYHRLLVPLHAQSLRWIAFALAIMGVSRLVAALWPAFGEALGGHGALLAGNCAVLGASLAGADGALARAALIGLLGGLGFCLAALLLAGVKERLEYSNVPGAMRGLPIMLTSAGLIALALGGFTGL